MALIRLTHWFFNIVDPFQIGRNYFVFPAWALVQKYYYDTKEKTMNGVFSVRDLVLRVIILLLAFGVVLWTAVFMYIAFYYTYMPITSHSRPAYMQFSSCENGKDICSFPQAYVALTKKQQLLMVGQPYRVVIVIDMPESQVNKNLGMFQVCAEMRDQKSNLRAHSCRSAILHFKSDLFYWISTWIKTPLYLLGLREEKQTVEVELFSSFHDDDTSPVTDVYLEIQSKHIHFYSVSVEITAHFTGLRYFMFHWPLLSAAVGVCTNLFFVILVCLLSWYHWNSDYEWLDDAKDKLEKLTKRKFGGSQSKNSSSTSSVEEVQNCDEDSADKEGGESSREEGSQSYLKRRLTFRR